MEEVVRRLIQRFMPEPGLTRYAIARSDGDIIVANLIREDEDYVRKVLASLTPILKPGEYMFMGGGEGGDFLFYRASEAIFIVLRSVRAPPGIMLSCARSMFRELEGELESGPRPPAPEEEEAPPAAPEAPEAPEEPVYELDPRFGSVDEALDALPPSIVARTIVANLTRPLTATQIFMGLRSLGLEVSEEEVKSALNYLKSVRVIRERKKAS